MEVIAKFIIVVSVLLLILFAIYKAASWMIHLSISGIKRNMVRKNRVQIAVEIEKANKLLNDLGVEQITREKARISGKNYTGIL